MREPEKGAKSKPSTAIRTEIKKTEIKAIIKALPNGSFFFFPFRTGRQEMTTMFLFCRVLTKPSREKNIVCHICLFSLKCVFMYLFVNFIL